MVSYLFFDSLYYFPIEYKPSYKATVYVSGGNFFPVAGSYTLPLHEGTYSLIPTDDKPISPARLVMNTRGGEQLYDHIATEYLNA